MWVYLGAPYADAFGYRRILRYQCGVWDNPRIVLAVASRFQGSGILCIGLSTYDTLASYASDVRFFGEETLANASGMWRCFYDTSTGIIEVYWRQEIHSYCNVTVLSRQNFPAPSNGALLNEISTSGVELKTESNIANAIAGVTASVKELNYMIGVRSNVQEQIDHLTEMLAAIN